VGEVIAGIAKTVNRFGNPVRRPAALIMGGETTVKVRGKGVGGRNQELTLSAAKEIAEIPNTVFASIGTDGIDGITSDAGAVADHNTIKRAEKLGMTAEEYLRENNSNTFFKRLNDVITTGPTGTNVGDLAVLCLG